MVLLALVLLAMMLPAPELSAGLRNIHCVIYIFSCMDQFQRHFNTLFCREFENVVIHAFLVLIFWAKNAAGATVCAFCNYDECTGRNNSIGINSKPIMEGHCKYLNEIVQPRQRDASFKKDKPAGCSSKARRTHPADGGILQGLPGPSLMFCVCIFRTAVIRRR